MLILPNIICNFMQSNHVNILFVWVILWKGSLAFNMQCGSLTNSNTGITLLSVGVINLVQNYAHEESNFNHNATYIRQIVTA